MNYAYKDTGRTKIIYADSSDIIKYNLEKEGFIVYTSYDGEDAL